MAALLQSLSHYFEAAEDVLVKDPQFLTAYTIFLEDLYQLYSKGPAAVPPSLIEKLSAFIREYVPASVRNKPIKLYRYQPYHVKTVHETVDGFDTTDFRFTVTSAADPIESVVDQVLADRRLFDTLAFASVLDDLPLHSPRIRDALKGAYSETQLKALVNKFRQQHPDATDTDLSRYLAVEVYPKVSNVLNDYNLDGSEKQAIREHLTDEEIRGVLEAFESAKQGSKTISEMDLKRMFRDAIKRKTGGNQTSVLDSVSMSPIDKDILRNKFSENQLRKMIDALKAGDPKMSNADLAVKLEKILDDYAADSVEHILTMVGKKKFDGEDTDDTPYTDKNNRNTHTVNKDQVKRIPPVMMEEGLPEMTVEEKKLTVNEPKDLYKALESYTHAGRVVFKTKDYGQWFLSEGVANFVAFKAMHAKPFDNNTFADVIEMPTIFEITVKDPDTMIPVAPHKLVFLFQQFNAEYLRRNFGANPKGLKELRLAVVRLSRIFRQKGMFTAVVHHRDPYRKVIPMHAYQADPKNIALKVPPDTGATKAATLLEAMVKL